jgi:hypothetical protein
MFLSEKQSRLLLHRKSGMTYAAIDAILEKSPKTLFGERKKFKLADLNKIIEDANRPTPIIIPANAPKVKPLNQRHVEQIRRFRGLPIL